MIYLLSIYLLAVYLSFNHSIYLFIYLYFYLSFNNFFLYFYLSFFLSFYLSFYLSIFLAIYLSFYLYIYLTYIYLSIYLYFYTSFYKAVYLSSTVSLDTQIFSMFKFQIRPVLIKEQHNLFENGYIGTQPYGIQPTFLKFNLWSPGAGFISITTTYKSIQNRKEKFVKGYKYFGTKGINAFLKNGLNSTPTLKNSYTFLCNRFIGKGYLFVNKIAFPIHTNNNT